MMVMVAVVSMVAGCADSGSSSGRTPLNYHSSLSAEHDAKFQQSMDVWEAVTGINLFDPLGRGASVSYGYVDPPNIAWTFDSGDIVFEENHAFSEYCSGDDPFGAFALHELCHAIGLSHSPDPDSVMYIPIRRCVLPSPEDIAAVRELWE